MFSLPLLGALQVLSRLENIYFHPPSPYDKVLRLYRIYNGYL